MLSSVLVHFSRFCWDLFAFSTGCPVGGPEFSLYLYGTGFQYWRTELFNLCFLKETKKHGKLVFWVFLSKWTLISTWFTSFIHFFSGGQLMNLNIICRSSYSFSFFGFVFFFSRMLRSEHTYSDTYSPFPSWQTAHPSQQHTSVLARGCHCFSSLVISAHFICFLITCGLQHLFYHVWFESNTWLLGTFFKSLNCFD